MENSVHGHEVMRMMIEADRPFTRKELEEAIIEKFGNDARFYTCSAQGMTAKELIELLEQKVKFIESDKGLVTKADKICDH